MLRLLFGIIMIVVYWGAYVVARVTTIIKPSEPDYLYFAEGPLMILLFAVLILSVGGVTTYVYNNFLPFVVLSLCCGILATSFVGIVLGMVFKFLFGGVDFEHNTIYLDHRLEWNVGFVIGWHIIAGVFMFFGIRFLVKRSTTRGDGPMRAELYKKYGIDSVEANKL